MSIYRQLDSLPKNRPQFFFKCKKEHIAKENIPNLTYPKQRIDTETTYGSSDHVLVVDTIKIMVNLEIDSPKTHSTVLLTM